MDYQPTSWELAMGDLHAYAKERGYASAIDAIMAAPVRVQRAYQTEPQWPFDIPQGQWDEARYKEVRRLQCTTYQREPISGRPVENE